MSDAMKSPPQAGLSRSDSAALAAQSSSLVSRGLELLSPSTVVSVVGPLALAIEGRSGRDPSRVLRICAYAVALARTLDLTEREIRTIELAALLRNIGMLAFEARSLDRSFAPKEIHFHPEVGAMILAATPPLAPAAPIVRYHHERWDGEGYPSGLKGAEIPTGARILAVVEYYDALTSSAPNDVFFSERDNVNLSAEEAYKVLQENAGRLFDPELVAQFASVIPTVDTSRLATTQMSAVLNAFGTARWVPRVDHVCRVLVVEDEPSVAELLAKTLALVDYHVDLVPEAKLALERTTVNDYDLLITDLEMPGMDGFTLIREVRRHKPDLPVIIVTGFSTESTAREAVRLGVAGYITKPFRVPQILAAIARVLGEDTARSIIPDQNKRPAKPDRPVDRAVPGVRNVFCVKFQRDLRGLKAPPWPGKLGQRIYDNVSAQAWQAWEDRQKAIVNEYRLMPWQKEAQELIEKLMEEFFFGKGADESA